MHWLRANRFGSWCAIIAFAIQLVSSFGHVHRGGTMSPFAFSFFTATASHLATTVPALGEREKPVDLTFDYCGVCTLIGLASTLCPPTAPELRLPNLVDGSRHCANDDFVSVPLRHFIFDARAPPQV